ncbi:transmembrane protein 102 [Eublepharis macularius]|uniref:Transmembrane protein 102 n=1 Tax=Eublepharis macularius TaxID=481883 RepID=A0AA97K8Z8_EUBMA|nr:transmembrane protein 102 [Eublepharis macularius]XP_054851144.1 transmembrane protein 102 [Eublepharis macularius]XP_054851145.1 transmembrane protein 102 [Eublepharis macularius]
MASPPEGHPLKPAPAKPLTDLDFHSGARVEELNQLIQEYEARNPGVREAPELHQAKDAVFSLLGVVQNSDGKLPAVNRYLILSGGVQQGTVDVDLGVPHHLSPGRDYDSDFTLLVPVLNAAGVPITLDMKQSPPGHTQISLQPFDPSTLRRWSDCCLGEEAYLSAQLVSAWFARSFASAAKGVRVELRGCVTSVVVSVGHYRVLYDIVPVVAFKGWPEVAQPWLSQAHFWDGKLRDEEVAGGFYLLPSTSGVSWRLAFSASEWRLRRTLPLPLLQAFRAATAVLGGHFSMGLRPYHLFTLVLQACERLPGSYLGREENAAHAWLGLLDDLSACLVHRCLPNYFLPPWNLLEGLSHGDMESLAQELARVRANPSKFLRRAVEGAKEAKRLAKAFQKQNASTVVS